MEITKNYTTPRIIKGKKPSFVPKGSTLEKEWAKNIWYINYSFNKKQYRVKENLNRIKDHKEKARQAEILLESIKNDLKNGFNPEKPAEYLEILMQNQININDAVIKYLKELSEYARPKTVKSYTSKLRYLVEEFDQKIIKSFTSLDLQMYISEKIKKPKNAKVFVNGRYIELNKTIPWTANTVRSAKGIFRAFFQWCITNKYYNNENPISQIEKKKIRSEVETSPRNIPFNEEDNKKIMDYLDDHEKLTAFFCRFIYYTCLRPGEISKLRIKDIDLENRQIKIPLNITKNTKKITVETIIIEDNLYEELKSLSLEKYPIYYYLCSNNNQIVGEESIGSNIPYKRLKKAMKIVGIDNKGYNLYSFKHFSNIQRYNSGWKILEIMKANRHSSVAMTEKYMKHINRDTDISNRSVPKI
jgi:integrase